MKPDGRECVNQDRQERLILAKQRQKNTTININKTQLIHNLILSFGEGVRGELLS